MSHDSENFNKQSFLGDFEKTNWNKILQSNQNKVNLTFNNYLNNVDFLINTHAPLKNPAKKKERKFQKKPWTTKGIHNSIHQKNKLFKKYIQCNNQDNKQSLHNQYKFYKNKLPLLMKQSKKQYYCNYFKNNIKNMQNIWKGIKSIISLKPSESESPKTIDHSKGEFLTNPIDIANSFNNFFCYLAPNIQFTIKKTFKSFHHYLTNPCVDSFLKSPYTKKEILEIMSNFDDKKSHTNNSNPLKILKLAKEPIAEHLCDIYNLSFTTGIDPDSLKIAKVTSIYKKAQILNVQTIGSSTCSPIFEKKLKN